MEELKPCPFCGSDEAVLYECADYPKSIGKRWSVICNHCDSQISTIYQDKWKAVNAWNTRAELTCENVHLFSGFRCSECKTTWHTLMRDEAGDWQKTNPKFCPNCGTKVTGAKVVDDE